MEILNNFSAKEFSWREAVCDATGQSSAGLFICFWYGIALIIIAFVCGVMIIISDHAAGANNGLLFVSIQMPIVLGYLLGRMKFTNDKTVIEKFKDETRAVN